MSHFYTTDGKSMFEVENKSKPGTFRPTTITDARKLKLIPSVTTILQYRARPDLDQWKMRQCIDSAFKTEQLQDELYEDWRDRVIEVAFTESSKSADTGTLIHAYIERLIQKQ